jgi:hypothetical protein
MAKTVTIKVPAMDKGGIVDVIPATGKVAWLKVGDRRVKFLIQDGPHGTPEFLTHFASGVKVGNINAIQIQSMCGAGLVSPRRACEILIDKIVAQYGAQRFHAVIDRADVLNGGKT